MGNAEYMGSIFSFSFLLASHLYNMTVNETPQHLVASNTQRHQRTHSTSPTQIISPGSLSPLPRPLFVSSGASSPTKRTRTPPVPKNYYPTSPDRAKSASPVSSSTPSLARPVLIDPEVTRTRQSPTILRLEGSKHAARRLQQLHPVVHTHWADGLYVSAPHPSELAVP